MGAATAVAPTGSVAVATFTDTGSGVPVLTTRPASPLAAPLRPNLVTLLTDKASVACVSGTAAGNGSLVTVGMDGTGVAVTPLGCDVLTGAGCPLLIAYEPFVF